MATVPSLANPTKDHPLYSKYTRTAMINRIVKLAVLAVVIIYLITVFFAPVFTTSTKVENADKKVMYEKSVSYTMSEVLDEQEKFNDEEQYFENVEDSVKYLKDKEFSELERIKNLEKANDKINAFFTTSEYVANTLGDMSENRPEEYIALAQKADAIEGYVTNDEGKKIPKIDYTTVASYFRVREKNKIAKLSEVFYEELEARNTDGLRAFLVEVENLNAVYAAGYTSEYEAELDELQSKYLVADYTFDEKFSETVNEIADVNQFIPASAMTKSLAEAIDTYRNMSGFAFSYASKNLAMYEAQYIYFEYDLGTNEIVYEQHSSIEYINLAVTIMRWGVIAFIAVAVIAMIPTVIGLITRKTKKLRSLSVFYAALPLFGLLLALFVSSSSLLGSQIDLIDVTCEVASVNTSAFLVVMLVIIAAIVTKVLVSSYCSKYNKWLKEAQATVQTTAENDAPEAETTEEKTEEITEEKTEEKTD